MHTYTHSYLLFGSTFDDLCDDVAGRGNVTKAASGVWLVIAGLAYGCRHILECVTSRSKTGLLGIAIFSAAPDFVAIK